MKLCFVMTVPYAFHAFLKGHIRGLIGQGHAVTICTNINQLGHELDFPDYVRVVNVPIARAIRPLRDIFVLAWLINFFLREKFDSVHSLLPKSGLLGMVAAFVAQVPVRVHTFTGQVWATSYGIKRQILKIADRIITRCANHVLADSYSQKDFLVSEGIVSKEKISVLGNGSICGVDVSRFTPNGGARTAIRRSHGIQENALVILFVGRIVREKGVVELIEAYSRLCMAYPSINFKLLFVGANEENLISDYMSQEGIAHLDFSSEIESYYSASDILCLPSYREGFGSVLIEAAAMKLPVVATRIYGITDAVIDEDTGLLVEVRDSMALYKALSRLIENSQLRAELGKRGRARVEAMFSQQIVTEAWLRFYADVFRTH